jgi:hypothetical protein
MPRQPKATAKISEKSTKNEILEAYQELMEQATVAIPEDETAKQKKTVVASATQETVEKVTTDLSQLRISANQTISSLTEQLTVEAERFATLQKAITIAQQDLAEMSQIKVQAGMLKRMVEVQKQEEEAFESEMAEKRTTWAQEQRTYEEGLKKQRSREEDEYNYERTLRLKREKDAFDEEKRAWERDMQEEKKKHAQQQEVFDDLQKRAAQFPTELDKALKAAVADALALERKDSQNRQNFSKQEWDSKQQIATLKIASLEQTVKDLLKEKEELKRQLESATQQVKDIAVKVIEGVKREPPPPPISPQPVPQKVA